MPSKSPKFKPARYALRRTLVPWNFHEGLAELLDFCRQTKVEEVIFKIDTEEFSHGIPSVAWARDYVALLAEARDALKQIGIIFSLNPWVTIGHAERGRDLRRQFPEFQWLVGEDGTLNKDFIFTEIEE